MRRHGFLWLGSAARLGGAGHHDHHPGRDGRRGDTPAGAGQHRELRLLGPVSRSDRGLRPASFYGTMGYSVPVELPSYHGLEPGIALAYNSEGRNGIVGVAGAWPASARSSA